MGFRQYAEARTQAFNETKYVYIDERSFAAVTARRRFIRIWRWSALERHRTVTSRTADAMSSLKCSFLGGYSCVLLLILLGANSRRRGVDVGVFKVCSIFSVVENCNSKPGPLRHRFSTTWCEKRDFPLRVLVNASVNFFCLHYCMWQARRKHLNIVCREKLSYNQVQS